MMNLDVRGGELGPGVAAEGLELATVAVALALPAPLVVSEVTGRKGVARARARTRRRKGGAEDAAGAGPGGAALTLAVVAGDDRGRGRVSVGGRMRGRAACGTGERGAGADASAGDGAVDGGGGGGTGAAEAAGPGSAATDAADAPDGMAVLRRWIARRRGLGMTGREMVFELHVRQGRPLVEVAELLEMPLAEARVEWGLLRAEMAERAPRAEAEFTMLREQLAAGLWTVVEQSQPRERSLDDAGREVETAVAPCPRLLALRLRALDQISKLYGVNLERPEEDHSPLPYAAPAEIAQEVRRKVLALHGRGEEGERGGEVG